MLAIILESQEDAERLVNESMKKGLILFYLLWNKLAVRITPPLTITNKEIKKGCKIILNILDEMI